MIASSCRYEPRASRVFRLIEYAQHFNKGQGIGFVIFDTTINRRALVTCKWIWLRARQLRCRGNTSRIPHHQRAVTCRFFVVLRATRIARSLRSDGCPCVALCEDDECSWGRRGSREAAGAFGPDQSSASNAGSHAGGTELTSPARSAVVAIRNNAVCSSLRLRFLARNSDIA